ncbi:MAG: DUF4861 family protein [Rikenellaceae bacterium]
MKIITLNALALLALSLISCSANNDIKVDVNNPSLFSRTEIVTLQWSDVEGKISTFENGFIILNDKGEEVPYQKLTYGEEKPQELIFQAEVAANETKTFSITAGKAQEYAPKAVTTFMPRRKDDISWENDCVSYRMYGPALEIDAQERLISGGIDIWVKNTPKLVTQQWYEDEFNHVSSYHTDNGEGLDYYSVGSTLGCGAAAPYSDGKLFYVNHNFKKYEILENGALRTVFRLTYDSYPIANEESVEETRTITLDAGSYLNKIVANYKGAYSNIEVGAGFPYYNNEDGTLINCEQGYIAYGLPEHKKHGVTYIGVIYPQGFNKSDIVDKQLVGVMSQGKQNEFTYFAGGGWSKGGFKTQQEWFDYIKEYTQRLKEPFTVEIK